MYHIKKEGDGVYSMNLYNITYDGKPIVVVVSSSGMIVPSAACFKVFPEVLNFK